MVKEPLESKSVFPGSSSTCYGTLAFCFLCFADSSAYPAPVSCGRSILRSLSNPAQVRQLLYESSNICNRLGINRSSSSLRNLE